MRIRKHILNIVGLGILILGIMSFSKNKQESLNIETFTFSSNGEDFKGKIYLPNAYENKKTFLLFF